MKGWENNNKNFLGVVVLADLSLFRKPRMKQLNFSHPFDLPNYALTSKRI